MSEAEQLKALVIDHNNDDIKLVTHILRYARYTTVWFSNAKEALECLGSININLILLSTDINDSSGFDIIDRIRSRSRGNEIPIIFITNDQTSENRVRSCLDDGDDYIQRSLLSRELLARVNSQFKIFLLRKELEKKNKTLEASNVELSIVNRTLGEYWHMVQGYLVQIVDFIRKTNTGSERDFFTPLEIKFNTHVKEVDSRLEEMVNQINITCLDAVADNTKREIAESEVKFEHNTAQLSLAVTASCNDADNVQDVLKGAIDAICEYLEWSIGRAFLVSSTFSNNESVRLEEKAIVQNNVSKVGEVDAYTNFDWDTLPDFESAEKSMQSGEVVWVESIQQDASIDMDVSDGEEIRSVLAFPAYSGDRLYAILTFLSFEASLMDGRLIELFKYLGERLGFAIEKKNKQRDLLTSEAYWRAVLAASFDPFVCFDETNDIVFASDSAYESFGYDETELLGEKVSILLDEAHKQLLPVHSSQLGESGKQFIKARHRVTVVRHDGSLYSCELSIAKSKPTETAPALYTVVFRPLSEEG